MGRKQKKVEVVCFGIREDLVSLISKHWFREDSIESLVSLLSAIMYLLKDYYPSVWLEFTMELHFFPFASNVPFYWLIWLLWKREDQNSWNLCLDFWERLKHQITNLNTWSRLYLIKSQPYGKESKKWAIILFKYMMVYI